MYEDNGIALAHSKRSDIGSVILGTAGSEAPKMERTAGKT
jgi:hypothetical protein